MRRLKPLVLLATLLTAPSADAEGGCAVPVYVWDLELTRVERLSGDVEPETIAAALGARARLRGGYRDPAHPKVAARAELMGSSEGAGLSVLAEKKEQ